jgi:hypothetical protein
MAGFDPHAWVPARRRLAGLVWQGRVLTATDQLNPAEEHFLYHVVKLQEWPPGTSLSAYLASIRRVILDPTSGVFTNQYFGQPSLAVVRESRGLRGSGGYEWVLVQYRVGYGRWVTAHQLAAGLHGS